MNTLMPEVSAWYQELASGNLFEVVAIDEASGSIEYQLLDGEVGEYDSASWQMLYLAPAEAPEDWRSPYALSTEDHRLTLTKQWYQKTSPGHSLSWNRN